MSLSIVFEENVGVARRKSLEDLDTYVYCCVEELTCVPPINSFLSLGLSFLAAILQAPFSLRLCGLKEGAHKQNVAEEKTVQSLSSTT